MVSNSALNSKALSWKAKGLYSYLQSKATLQGWKFNKKHLQSMAADGRDSVETGIKELKSAGYLDIVETRAKGQFSYEWIIYDTPEEKGNSQNEETSTAYGKPVHGERPTEYGKTVYGKPVHGKDNNIIKNNISCHDKQDSEKPEYKYDINVFPRERLVEMYQNLSARTSASDLVRALAQKSIDLIFVKWDNYIFDTWSKRIQDVPIEDLANEVSRHFPYEGVAHSKIGAQPFVLSAVTRLTVSILTRWLECGALAPEKRTAAGGI